MNATDQIKTLHAQNWILLLILGAASAVWMAPPFTMGLILGGLLMIANFRLLEQGMRAAFTMDGPVKVKKRSILVKYYFRLAILGIIIYIVITNGWVNPVGLVIGLSIVVFSIIQLAVRAVGKTSSGEAI
jgi:hypothetical protein